MTEMVERVARAIWNAEPNVGHWCDWEDLLDDDAHTDNLLLAERYRGLARAALAARREPTTDWPLDAFLAEALNRTDDSDGAWDSDPSVFYGYVTCEKAKELNALLRTLG